MSNLWDKYHEKLIRKRAEMAKTYSIMHSLCAQYYSKWHKRLGVPIVLLGGIAASSIFSNNHNDPEDTEFWNYLNGAVTLTMTGLAGVSNFLSLEEKKALSNQRLLDFLQRRNDFEKNGLTFDEKKILLTHQKQLPEQDFNAGLITSFESLYLNGSFSLYSVNNSTQLE